MKETEIEREKLRKQLSETVKREMEERRKMDEQCERRMQEVKVRSEDAVRRLKQEQEELKRGDSFFTYIYILMKLFIIFVSEHKERCARDGNVYIDITITIIFINRCDIVGRQKF